MAVAKRITLFILVNILVITTVTIVLNVFNVRPYLDANGIDYQALLIFCLIWGMVGSFISLALSKILAKWMMKIKIIKPEEASGHTAELLRIVQRLSNSAGMSKMPEVGIYDSPEVNAFATGPTKKRSLVAVSSGLLNRMNSQQVEGVLAHEIAHIANGDMVTMTLIQGIINAFVMFFARIVAFAISQNVKAEMRFVVRFASIIIFQILFSILGSVVVSYFSRWREFRADAGGAKLAGRDKMIAALKALAGTEDMIDTEHQGMASLKISGKRSKLMVLLSTHPPLEERIQRLERGQY